MRAIIVKENKENTEKPLARKTKVMERNPE